MLRSLHMLVLALATTLAGASSAPAITAETALRANSEISQPRVTDLAAQAREALQQSALGYGESASDSSLASRAAPRIGPRWGARSITDAACRTGCERVAAQIQKHIGGDIKRIVPADPRATNLGAYRGSSPGWAHHEVVVKDGRVYDAFTGHKGATISVYKSLWEHADAINFGF